MPHNNYWRMYVSLSLHLEKKVALNRLRSLLFRLAENIQKASGTKFVLFTRQALTSEGAGQTL